MNVSGDVVFVAIVCVVAFVSWILNWISDEPSPPDRDHDGDKRRREAALQAKREAAIDRMKKLGIKSLLDGRKAWATIRPMHAEEEAPKAHKIVVPMRRAR